MPITNLNTSRAFCLTDISTGQATVVCARTGRVVGWVRKKGNGWTALVPDTGWRSKGRRSYRRNTIELASGMRTRTQAVNMIAEFTQNPLRGG